MGGREEPEEDIAKEVAAEEEENEENKNGENEEKEDEKKNEGVATNNNAHLIRQIGPITIN